MSNEVITIMATIICICVLIGIVYPILAALFYPAYKMLGGEKTFFKYMRDI